MFALQVFGSEAHPSEIAARLHGFRVNQPTICRPPDRCGHARWIRDPLEHPLRAGGGILGNSAQGGWLRRARQRGSHRGSALGQGREEFAGDGGDGLAFGRVVGDEDH